MRDWEKTPIRARSSIERSSQTDWCAATAIVTARDLALAGQDVHARKQWIDPRRCVHRRQQAAEALAREVGLGTGAWGPDELTRVVMAPSVHDYKIIVVDASRAYSLVAYQTPRPLDPRDAFFGGRINAYQLYRHVEGDERILCYDFKSLYPYVNKYCCSPIGHPQIISQPPLDQGLDAYFGLVCCTILPPTDLLHPVLRYRCSQKLTFPLSAACVRQYIDAPLLVKNVDDCHQTDAQHALTCTW